MCFSRSSKLDNFLFEVVWAWSLEAKLKSICRISIGKMSVYWLGSLKLLAKNLRDGIKNNMFHTEKWAVLHYLKRWKAANFHKPKITFICEFAHSFPCLTANPETVSTLKHWSKNSRLFEVNSLSLVLCCPIMFFSSLCLSERISLIWVLQQTNGFHRFIAVNFFLGICEGPEQLSASLF